MGKAKGIRVQPIAAADAHRIVRALHYSGKTVNNSQLHLGVFLGGRCGGVMQFGPPMDKRKLIDLVQGTPWNGFLELNRMAFADWLPRNSESRAIAYAMRFLRKSYPHLQWVVSFADATQCGDGTIYRASGFVLTAISPNDQIVQLPDGSRTTRFTISKGPRILANRGRAGLPADAVAVPGFQLRYLYFLDPTARQRLTVPVLPFSAIAQQGAGMYRGVRRAGSADSGTPVNQTGGGGADPTPALSLPTVEG